MKVPRALSSLVEALGSLPGVGTHSAERIAFHLFKSPGAAERLVQTLKGASELKICGVCGSIGADDPCSVCASDRDDKICVVERPADVFLIEEQGFFSGRYHVLGGVLAPAKGVGPDDLNLRALLDRLDGVTEVILALSPTVEGDSTAYYVSGLLKPLGVRVSRIARGLPTGTDLSLADPLTLREAFEGRREME